MIFFLLHKFFFIIIISSSHGQMSMLIFACKDKAACLITLNKDSSKC